MPIILLFLLLIFLTVIVSFFHFFVSRKTSPIPYFPSHHKDIPLIIKTINLQKGEVLYDLGAGDGVVVFEAASTSLSSSPPSPPPRFLAIEINPILIAIMKLRRLFHPQKSAIEITKGDIFSMSLPRPPKYTPVFFMYISPWFMEKTITNILRQYKSIELVSYFYAAPKSRTYKIALKKHVKNIHDIYRYTITRSR